MPREIAFLDALMPGLVPVFLLALLLQWALDWLFGRFGLYRHVWHPPLFRLALFAGVFGTLGLISMR
jgi:hypothetical protein